MASTMPFSIFSTLLKGFNSGNKGDSDLPFVPEVPGLPVIGNLLQLKEKKPHKTFLNWVDTYGPIYSIKTGASTVVVLNSNDIAKEAMVTRYSSISSRKLSSALQSLTHNKCMVAMSDYDDFHKMIKRFIIVSMLGPKAQKQHRCHRDTMMDNISAELSELVKKNPLEAVNFRHVLESETFGLAMKQALGKDFKSVYVDDLGVTLSRDEIFNALVSDMMAGAIEVDWRDFFPYMKWIPNKSFELNIQHLGSRRDAIVNALIGEQTERIALGEKVNCYLDFFISDPEAAKLTEKQKAMLIWESIIEASDTTIVTTEWALDELAKDPTKQDSLYREIQRVCGSEKLTEEHLSQLPYLTAVFHETLRKHSPAPLVPLRYAHEDTQLGGFFIPAGTQIAINLYGCNMDKKQWENPEEWNPERFLNEKYDGQDLYKTMAFGAGKRSCAGSLQAMLVSCHTIGRLVQEFEWSLKDGDKENVNTAGFTNQKLDPLHAILKPRNT